MRKIPRAVSQVEVNPYLFHLVCSVLEYILDIVFLLHYSNLEYILLRVLDVQNDPRIVSNADNEDEKDLYLSMSLWQ